METKRLLRGRTVHAIAGALLLALMAGCSLPPRPSPETAALEPHLLTPGDVGIHFEEESRGQAGVSGGSVCPRSDFKFKDMGMVRVSFIRQLNRDDEIELTEQAYVVENGEIDTLMDDLEAAYEACYGEVWTDYGQTQTVEPLASPSTGPRTVSVRWFGGDAPFDGRIDYVRKVYVAAGDVFLEIDVAERIDGRVGTPEMTDAEFFDIVAKASARIP